MSDQVIKDALQAIAGRFYGKYRGIVTDVDAKTMRIKAKVPAVFADADSGWAMPCVPFAGASAGFAFLPDKGSAVWIEFEGGDVSFPIWTGGFWLNGQAPAQAAPDVRVVVTKQHQLLLDEKGVLTVKDRHGNSLTMDKNGITLKRGSQTLVISDSSVNVNDGALEIT